MNQVLLLTPAIPLSVSIVAAGDDRKSTASAGVDRNSEKTIRVSVY